MHLNETSRHGMSAVSHWQALRGSGCGDAGLILLGIGSVVVCRRHFDRRDDGLQCDCSTTTRSRSHHILVRDWRLPRAVADVLVGAALAVAGAIMQAVTRNPLASPGIMGLNTGASFATLLAMVLVPTAGRPQLMLVVDRRGRLGRCVGLRPGFAFPRRTDARSAGPDRHCRLGLAWARSATA